MEVMYREVFNVEVQGFTRPEPGGYQVPDNFLLAIDHDGTTRQLFEVDPVTAPCEVQTDAVMKQPLLHHASTDTGGIQDVHALVFEHARTHAIFNVMPAFCLQHHRLDTALMQELGQQQPRGTGADDRNLGSHES
jgi:hypothetical protein